MCSISEKVICTLMYSRRHFMATKKHLAEDWHLPKISFVCFATIMLPPLYMFSLMIWNKMTLTKFTTYLHFSAGRKASFMFSISKKLIPDFWTSSNFETAKHAILYSWNQSSCTLEDISWPPKKCLTKNSKTTYFDIKVAGQASFWGFYGFSLMIWLEWNEMT